MISWNCTCCDVDDDDRDDDDDDHDHHRKCNFPEISDFTKIRISGTWPVRRTEVCTPTESLCDYVLGVTSVARRLEELKSGQNSDFTESHMLMIMMMIMIIIIESATTCILVISKISGSQVLGRSGLVRRTEVCTPTESLCDYVLRVTSVAQRLKGVENSDFTESHVLR